MADPRHSLTAASHSSIASPPAPPVSIGSQLVETLRCITGALRETVSAPDPGPPDSNLLTVEQVAFALGCGRTTVFRLIRSKGLKKAKSPGRKTLVTRESVSAYIRSRLPAEKPGKAPGKPVVRPNRRTPTEEAKALRDMLKGL